MAHVLREALARAYAAAMRPGGRRALDDARAHGLPKTCEPALRFLFGEPLDPAERRAADAIEGMRAALTASKDDFQVLDTNCGTAHRTGRIIADRASVPAMWGIVLLRLARASGARTLLELGSCAGISTSYLAAGAALAHDDAFDLVGVEGGATLAALAHTHARQISSRASVLHARFDDVIDRGDVPARALEFVYIDGEHTREARLRYLAGLRARLVRGSIVVFDDIHYSTELWRTWNDVRQSADIETAITFGRFGVCCWSPGAARARHFDFSRYTGWLRVGSRWK